MKTLKGIAASSLNCTANLRFLAFISFSGDMMWLDTKEEVDFDWFMEVLDNDELQVVSRKLTEEDKKELSRQIAECRAMRRRGFSSSAPPREKFASASP